MVHRQRSRTRGGDDGSNGTARGAVAALLFAVAGAVLAAAAWLHARSIGPLVDWLDEGLLGAWEESAKLLVREFFAAGTRLINGTCAAALALVDRDYRANLRRTWQQKEAWHSWWREERTSTLNAVLAAQCPAPPPGSNSSSGGGGSGAPTPRGAHHGAGATTRGSTRRPVVHISWGNTNSAASATAAAAATSPSTAGNRSRAASAGGGLAVPAAGGGGGGGGGPPSSPNATGPRGSWPAQLVWWLQLRILGRSRANTAVAAVATGRSSNPLLRSPPQAGAPSLSRVGCDPITAADTAAAASAAANTTAPLAYGSAVGTAAETAAAAARRTTAAGGFSMRGLASWAAGLLTALVRLPLLPFLLVRNAIMWPWRTGAAGGAAAAAHNAAAAGGGVAAPAGTAGAAGGGPDSRLFATAAASTAAARMGRARVRGRMLLRRSIVFEQPSGFGVHEHSKRRGLIEVCAAAGDMVVQRDDIVQD